MDKASSVIAAIDAGKLPSQQQISVIIDWVLQSIIVDPVKVSDIAGLSKKGQTLALHLRKVLMAYKELGTNKNYDNLVQQMLWHLEEVSVNVQAMDVVEAAADYDDFRSSVRTLIKILWSNIMGEGNVLLNDFASFTRLTMADLAEFAETQASGAKDTLRDLDTQVQQGQKDNLGRTMGSEEKSEHEDAKAKFEKTMETVKETGSSAIGTVQSAQAKVQDTTEKASSRIQDAFFAMIEGAQRDPEYKHAMSTILGTLSKWADKATDTVADTEQPLVLETFVEDSTEEKHLHHALYQLRTISERVAGGRSLDTLITRLRLCAADVKQDKDLNAWFKQLFEFMRVSLETPIDSPKVREGYDRLSQEWRALLDEDSDKARKWKEDIKALRGELAAFRQAVRNGADIVKLRDAHAKLVLDIEELCAPADKLAAPFYLTEGSWFRDDLLKVYVPRIFQLLRDIPIPRTEYVDGATELVLENLRISSFNLLPGHMYIRNITDADITATPGKSPETAWGTLTHIKLQAIQLKLDEVSFYYRDNSATVGPKVQTGVLVFNVPEQGLDIDFTFRLIPDTDSGRKERERQKRFFKVDAIKACLLADKFTVTQSNHPIFASVFKPIVTSHIRAALERAIVEHIRGVFDAVDGAAFDISKRAEVFEDAGLGRGPAIVAAFWSEIGRLRRLEGGLLHGWTATGTGIVKEGLAGGATLAVGAEPQILSGEKRGPLGTFAEPLTEAVGEAAAGAKSMAGEGIKQVQSFEETVRQKTQQEKNAAGWESEAFDFKTGANA